MRALYDLSKRFDLALSARARFDGGWDQRTDGLGAELGVVVTKNLRLSGGYNAFGFHDADFASMERTDKGPFVAFGFKFDEGLFGGSGASAAPATAVNRALTGLPPRVPGNGPPRPRTRSFAQRADGSWSPSASA